MRTKLATVLTTTALLAATHASLAHAGIDVPRERQIVQPQATHSTSDSSTPASERVLRSTATTHVQYFQAVSRAQSQSLPAPGRVSATAGKNSIAVSWTGVKATGSQRVTYKVIVRPAGGKWSAAQCAPSLTRCNVSGLKPGIEHEVRVQARTNTVKSTITSPRRATPYDVTTPPLELSAVPTANADEAYLSWQVPLDTRGDEPDSYVVEQRVTEGEWEAAQTKSTRASISTEVVVSDLEPESSYEFRVAAQNAAGLSDWSDPASMFVAGETPGSVTQLAAVPGNGNVTLSWVSPVGTGSPVTSYTVSVSPQEGTVVYPALHSSTGATVTGLSNGVTYTFIVRAVNLSGPGPDVGITATPRALPSAVTGLIATVVDKSLVLTWPAPNDGGSSILDYLVQHSTDPSGPWVLASDGYSSVTSTTLTGLALSRAQYVRVAAVTLSGAGPWSAYAVTSPTTSAGTGTGSGTGSGTGAGTSSQKSFTFVGQTNQTFTVPSGVTRLQVDMAGGQGGYKGAGGSRIQTTIEVTPGQTLIVQVAEQGQGVGYQCLVGPFASAGGWPGGGASGSLNLSQGCTVSPGGGGGYSGLFLGRVAHETALVVAGGGGGGDEDTISEKVGVTGGDGGNGSLTSGGAAGSPNNPLMPPTSGGPLQGGNGGHGDNSWRVSAAEYVGGGGGGGYYGGGGGGSGSAYNPGGAGGAGSSYSIAQATVTPGYQFGNGYVTLSW